MMFHGEDISLQSRESHQRTIDMSNVSTLDWVKIFFRSLYIQAAWNYERMQALGFAASMVPIIEKVSRTKDERASFLVRHLEFFNAHPYFVNFALGASIRLEEVKEVNMENQIRTIKNELCGPLGSLGDQLFWNGLRPMAGLIGAIIALHGSWWGSIFFLFLLNVPHLGIRYWGLKRGYDLGPDVARELVRPIYRKAMRATQLIGAVAIGFYIGGEAGSLSKVHINHLVLFLLFIILCWVALKRRLSLYLVFPGVVFVGLIATYLM